MRFRLGDVEGAYPIASDEECLQALADNGGNAWLAAATVAEAKATVFLMRPSMERRNGHIIQWHEQALAFRTLAETLRRKASLRTTTLYAGGIDRAEHDAQRRDHSLVPPTFTTDLHDTPGTWDPAREDV